MKKILVTFGTRPEAIKMAPVIKELEKYPENFEVKVCVTAQHRQMLDQILEVFSINPDFDLNIMKDDQDIYDITIKILTRIKNILKDEHPDLVLVHGDTTTTFAASLAAFYQQIKVGHVEAGLRTNNIYSPFPEEMNRLLTTRLSTYNFAPTESNRENLVREGVDEAGIIVTGNTVIDALLMILDRIEKDQELLEKIERTITKAGFPVIGRPPEKKILLITGHRRENFGEGFKNICNAIKEIASKFPDLDLIYPVHMNPNVLGPVKKILSEIDNVYLIKPLPYEAFILLMKSSHIILTDSGGIQEESPTLSVPTVVMRETTERKEAVDAGTVALVGTNRQKIIDTISSLMDNPDYYQKMANSDNPYGDGRAAGRIVDFLKKTLH
jgi:UDP-N-acetylglucosamine 2-epimerase (non-hydrolysing)